MFKFVFLLSVSFNRVIIKLCENCGGAGGKSPWSNTWVSVWASLNMELIVGLSFDNCFLPSHICFLHPIKIS